MTTQAEPDQLLVVEPAAAGPVGPAGPALAATWSVTSLLAVLTKVGPPLTVVTALLIYFGWARADAQSKAMGVDVSMFGYSTQDYVLRSISTLYLPLLVIAGLGLGWLAVDRYLTEPADTPETRNRLHRLGSFTLLAGTMAALGAVLWAWARPGRGDLVVPLVVAGGAAVAAYGSRLRGWAGPERSDRAAPASSQRALRAVLVGGIVTLALFWELSSYAGVVGRGYAERLARTADGLPQVTVSSPDPLGVLAPGVTEEAVSVPGPAGSHAVRYRTSGLRLLVNSGGRVFLLTEGWRPGQGAVIVLPDNDTLRWQLSR